MVKKIENGILYFDGCNTLELAKKYNTPLYVISENEIINRCKEIRESFLNKYPNTKAVYASKAFLSLAMCKIIEREGLGLDVVSGGELYTAIEAGFPAEKLEFNGNNKSASELRMAVSYGVGRIIVDNTFELDLLEEICKSENKTAKILFRITPGVKINTHKYITTGNKDSKFGIPLNENIIYPAIEKAIKSEHIEFIGFHYHVGSQLHDNRSHLAALETSLALVNFTIDKYGYTPSELNIGGGFGIKYTENDNPKPLSYFIDPIMDRIERFCTEKNLDMMQVIIEPGRWVIGEAGITLYTIGSIKDIPNIRKYVAVDGGMTDNIRPALYQAQYDAVIANKASKPKTETVTICGKCCESGDILIKDINTPNVEADDILAVFSTGAYGYSMSNNYNRNVIPAVVLVNDGNDELIVKRQSYQDMLRNDLVPERLR
ncbi:diaminopimelate decarboxylase [Abyssisolibacter fermentans]|uniref:diaminopimelate decarboxylase n=1 Tax=Abyssisolibacter fermentans TaxID=1766203 RepID=UPI000833103C|nr:diaminopimelate decarboxylase [Abyssisolibacter fermentans]